MTLHVVDPADFVARAAQAVVDAAQAAIGARGRFIIALSGGGTPEPVYAALAQEPYATAVDWSRVVVLFGDERCVPPDDQRSNYRMVRRAWLDPAGIPAANVLRIRGEDDPAVEALRYERQLASLLRTARRPVLDLVLLGMGDNGHTASLFPGTAALRERDRDVVAQYVEVMQTWRITMTAPLINNAREVLFLVQGAGKADMVRNVLAGRFQPDVWPSQLIEPTRGRLTWLLDADAAARVGPAQ